MIAPITHQSEPHQPLPDTVTLTNRHLVLGLLIISCVVAALFLPRANDFFTSDDFDFLAVWAAQDGAFSAEIWFAGAVAYWPGVARPLVGLTGWPLYHLAGTVPFGWHLVSLVLHLIVVWLTAFLVLRIVRSPGAALAAAAIFAVHFIHAEPVTWISGRSALMMAALVLGTVLAETAPRRRPWGAGRILGLVLGAGAILTHEAAIMLPCLLLLVPDEPHHLKDHTAGSRVLSKATVAGLGSSMRRQWPYWTMVALFAASHLVTTAAAFSTQDIYRVHLGMNVPKNIGFAGVANLFPLDFRALLAVWNQWNQSGETSSVISYLLAHPGVIVALTVTILFWAILFLTSHPAVRRLGAWVFVAGVPGFLLPGTGERLLYLGSVGGAGALGALLAGWHPAFVETLGRPGRAVIPLIVACTCLLHIGWLRDRLRDWESAADLSHAIVLALDTAARTTAPGTTLYVTDLPDNINGAWVFRTSIDDAYRVFGSRPDVAVVECDSLALAGLPLSGPVYRWNGVRFVRQSGYGNGE